METKAAAPELLEMLKEAVRMLLYEDVAKYPGFNDNHPFIYQAKAAITKATE
ncbi:MAG: hypothetical protein GY774_35575 [Planctomycetes bacterium]|nr:hypothetical protein [Planctomycetota bacterium]